MKWLRKTISRFGALLGKHKLDAEMDEEMRAHVEMRERANLAAGMPPVEAAREARKVFGDTNSVREECREVRGSNFGESFIGDIQFGLRMLLKNPGFSAVSILTLGLGVGATTAIFSVVYGVLINPYPYGHAGQIWSPGIKTANNTQVMRRYTKEEYEAMRALPEVSAIMGTAPGSALLSGEYAPEEIEARQMTLNGFQFLEVPPILGRVFSPSDVAVGGDPEPVTVITYRLWQRLFNGDPKALGKKLRLDDREYTVIGVMPERFGWWTSDGLWLPLQRTPEGSERVFPIMRFKPGANLDDARKRLQATLVEAAKANPKDFPKEDFQAILTNYLDMTVASGPMEKTLKLLFAAVGFLLLIACANVANLQLARATTRAREMAVRLAVGAARGRLVRQLLTESVLLSVLGGALGLGLSTGLTRLLLVLMPDFYIPNEARIEVNGYVLLFCLVTAMVTGIVFGLAPALQSSKPDLARSLKEDSRGHSSSHGGLLRSGLVAAEVAFSVMLLVSAALTIRSFIALQHVDPGYRMHHVVMANFTRPAAKYPTLAGRNQFDQELLERIQRLPGVEAADIGNGGVPYTGPDSTYSIDGRAGPKTQSLGINLISADYLKTMGMPLLRGRMLDENDISHGRHFVVINQAAAKLWPQGEDPIGRQIQVDIFKGGDLPSSVLMPPDSSADFTVIGICGDTRNNGLTSQTQPAVLAAYTLIAPPDRVIAMRTGAQVTGLMNAVREQVRQMDPQLPLRNVRSIEDAVQSETVQPRFTMVLFSLFGALGLALSVAGIYCVLSYLVSQRTREIGVRMALGAQRWDVLRLVVTDGGELVILGLLLGLVGSIGAARLLANQIELFNVGAGDLPSFLGVAVILISISALACWIPARRAARVDPMVALRHE
jgi:predicted permease